MSARVDAGIARGGLVDHRADHRDALAPVVHDVRTMGSASMTARASSAMRAEHIRIGPAEAHLDLLGLAGPRMNRREKHCASGKFSSTNPSTSAISPSDLLVVVDRHQQIAVARVWVLRGVGQDEAQGAAADARGDAGDALLLEHERLPASRCPRPCARSARPAAASSAPGTAGGSRAGRSSASRT